MQRTIEHRQGLKVGCIEEIAFRKGFIGADELFRIASYSPRTVGQHLRQLAEGADGRPNLGHPPGAHSTTAGDRTCLSAGAAPRPAALRSRASAMLSRCSHCQLEPSGPLDALGTRRSPIRRRHHRRPAPLAGQLRSG